MPNLSITDALIQVRNEVIETTYQMQEPEFSVALNKPFYFNPQAAVNDSRQKAAAQREHTKLQRERERLAQERKDAIRTQAKLKEREASLARKEEAVRQAQRKIQAEEERQAFRREIESTPTTPTGSGKFFRDRLKDGSQGPEMVWIKGGSFRMGDIQGGGLSSEKPVHSVSVARFAMGRYEVTFAEYDKFAEATGRKKPNDRGWGRGNRPVINVSWDDATAYAAWLSQQTGHTYRLPTEAQWEYAARAGTTTKYWWGNDIGSNKANCYGNYCGDRFEYTAPVGSFSPNPFGLYDTVGNVWEWTCSKYENRYNGEENRCSSQKSGSLWALRGGAWDYLPRSVRAANRLRYSHDNRDHYVGLRLARLL